MTAVTQKDIAPLDKAQGEHFNNMLQLVNLSQIALDKSPTGGGKTFAAGFVAQKKGFRVCAICPAHTIPVWNNLFTQFNIPRAGDGAYSFESQRPEASRHDTKLVHTTKTAQSSSVEEEEGEEGDIVKTKVEYNTPTDAEPSLFLKQLMLNDAILFVVDEYHRAKNAATATSVLVRAIFTGMRDHNAAVARGEAKYFARGIMASATPYDKESYALGFLRAIGVVRYPRLVDYDSRGRPIQWPGLTQLLNYATALFNVPFLRDGIFPAEQAWFAQVIQSPQADPRTSQFNEIDFAYQVSHRIIEPAITSAVATHNLRHGRNVFYNVDPKDRPNILVAVVNLQNTVGFNPQREDVKKVKLGVLNSAFQAFEASKLPIFMRVAGQILAVPPTSEGKQFKVLIMVKFKKGITDQLEQYFTDPTIFAATKTTPLIISGDVDMKERERRQALFNAHDAKYRLVIVTLQTGGESISLHDTSPGGMFPRISLIDPTFSAIEMIQAAGRIDRRGVTSTPSVIFVWPRVPDPGVRVIDALQRKYEVLRNVAVSARVKSEPMLLPDQYPAIIEGDAATQNGVDMDTVLRRLESEMTPQDMQVISQAQSQTTAAVGTASRRAPSSGRGRGKVVAPAPVGPTGPTSLLPSILQGPAALSAGGYALPAMLTSGTVGPAPLATESKRALQGVGTASQSVRAAPAPTLAPGAYGTLPSVLTSLAPQAGYPQVPVAPGPGYPQLGLTGPAVVTMPGPSYVQTGPTTLLPPATPSFQQTLPYTTAGGYPQAGPTSLAAPSQEAKVPALSIGATRAEESRVGWREPQTLTMQYLPDIAARLAAQSQAQAGEFKTAPSLGQTGTSGLPGAIIPSSLLPTGFASGLPGSLLPSGLPGQFSSQALPGQGLSLGVSATGLPGQLLGQGLPGALTGLTSSGPITTSARAGAPTSQLV